MFFLVTGNRTSLFPPHFSFPFLLLLSFLPPFSPIINSSASLPACRLRKSEGFGAGRGCGAPLGAWPEVHSHVERSKGGARGEPKNLDIVCRTLCSCASLWKEGPQVSSILRGALGARRLNKCHWWGKQYPRCQNSSSRITQLCSGRPRNGNQDFGF